jgi:hypothetical protein
LFRSENRPDQTDRRKRDCVDGGFRSAKQKSPIDPRGSFGLPSQSRTNNIGGPANIAQHRAIKKN